MYLNIMKWTRGDQLTHRAWFGDFLMLNIHLQNTPIVSRKIVHRHQCQKHPLNEDYSATLV